MNRREFLHPRRLAKMAKPMLEIADSLESLDLREATSSMPVMLRFARKAMATTFEVVLPFGSTSPNECASCALDEIDRIESQLTVYRDTSEVSRLNARAYVHPVNVEAGLFDLLTLAERIHRDTEGAFDISIGAMIKCWGFFRRAGRLPDPDERATVRERIGMQFVQLNATQQSVFYRRHGLEINFGSIGKGYALDRAFQLVRQHWNPRNLLMHGGHSSVLAYGDESPNTSGWTIGLLDPERPQHRRGLLHLRNRAMGTSAITYQQFEHEGRRLGHLLDPRTAWPAEGMLSATATASTAAEADALATAFFILGVEKACAYCEQHRDVGAVVISADEPRCIHVAGRAVDEFELLR